MNKALTIAAVAALTLGAAACHKSDDANTSNVSAEDNMLVPADENSMGDMNSMGATDNMAMDNSAMAGNDTTTASNNAM
ncbi:hypothetical protein [uncultured Sphingomonas sp.]|jgi:hypothetical protein|uniref:hypothetical protein n=1 Tax=uncultured Sphingomonas sp. TaxID=158754 RepID=UPI00261AED74|nr:hypothetical protein [uncultured Sphingomonas sp.]